MEIDETEFMSGTVSQLVEAITATEVEPGPDGRPAFTSTSPDWWGGDRTFGGMVVAQALHAATRTVPEGLGVHSLHGTEVDGRTVFRMACSFHSAEEGDEYQLAMDPDITPPDAVEGFEAPFPFDIRELGATDQREDGTFLSTRRCWFRTRERLADDPAIHACVLAYFSDMTGASFRPHSLGTWGTHTDASLDHALWFHRPKRADEWSIFDLQALVNAGGRATIRATMHGDDGALHLSMAQELLIRKLEVPIIFEAPPWAEKERRRLVPGEQPEGDGDGAA